MTTRGAGGTRMRLLLLAAIGALMLLPATPAAAQSKQDADIHQECNGDTSSSDVSSSGSDSGTDDCANQRDEIDQDAEGEGDRSGADGSSDRDPGGRVEKEHPVNAVRGWGPLLGE